MDNKLTPAQITVVASGLVTFIFSFVTWFGEGPFTTNGWDEFPLFTYPGLCGAAMAAVVLIKTFSSVQLPARVAGFTWTQIHQVLALIAVLVALGTFIAIGDSKIGLIVSVLGSIGLLIGAIMLRSDNPSDI